MPAVYTHSLNKAKASSPAYETTLQAASELYQNTMVYTAVHDLYASVFTAHLVCRCSYRARGERRLCHGHKHGVFTSVLHSADIKAKTAVRLYLICYNSYYGFFTCRLLEADQEHTASLLGATSALREEESKRIQDAVEKTRQEERVYIISRLFALLFCLYERRGYVRSWRVQRRC